MRFDDTISLRGSLAITVLRGRRVIENWRDDNMIMSAARDALAQLIAGDGAGKVITAIGVGSGGDGPTPADTALAEAFTKPLLGHDYPAMGRVRFNWRLESHEANGMAIREFGLITADGTLFARKSRPAIEKADDISVEGQWTIIF